MREEPHARAPRHDETAPTEEARGERLPRGLVVLATIASALAVTSGTAVTISLLGT